MPNDGRSISIARATRHRAAFTLVELLVVIGIMVLIAGIALPMIVRSYRAAGQARIAADLQAIGSGLEAFKADHGDYPRVGAPNLGAALLGKNLIGPLGDGYLPGSTSATPDDPNDPPGYDNTVDYAPGATVQAGFVQYVALVDNNGQAPAGNPTIWAPLGAANQGGGTDGADGPGIRIRAGGKKYGPYLADGRFKVRGLAILDINDNPILYFPARPVKPDITLAGGYLPPIAATPGNVDSSLYDPSDNWRAFVQLPEMDPNTHVATNNRPAQWRIHAMLGDYETNGGIDTAAGEQAIADQPYLLWSAGRDGFFGPREISDGAGAAGIKANKKSAGDCDDVTNFR